MFLIKKSTDPIYERQVYLLTFASSLTRLTSQQGDVVGKIIQQIDTVASLGWRMSVGLADTAITAVCNLQLLLLAGWTEEGNLAKGGDVLAHSHLPGVQLMNDFTAHQYNVDLPNL